MPRIARTCYIRKVVMARASVIIVLPDKDSGPQERNRDVDALAERIHNLIEIVAVEIDIFSALRPEDRHFGAVVRNKEDVDVVRVAAVLATMLAVFVVVVVISVVVVRAPFHDDWIGLGGGVHLLIARRHALKPG